VAEVTAAMSSILASSVARAAASSLARTLVDGVRSVGHVRPASSFFQAMAGVQSSILVPGADGMLVADAPSIKAHLAKATVLTSPFATAVLRPDLAAAVAHHCAFAGNDEGFERDRMRRVDAWDAAAVSMRSAHDECASMQSKQSRYLMADGASIPLIALAAECMQWPDVGFAVEKIVGFQTVGEYPDTGIFRTVDRPRARKAGQAGP